MRDSGDRRKDHEKVLLTDNGRQRDRPLPQAVDWVRGMSNQQILFMSHDDVAMGIDGTKFSDGSGEDGKHYWLTPPYLMEELNAEFHFDFDACPYPVPQGFDGLTVEWGSSTYVNPPFGSIIHNGKKKGPTAWARKAIEEAGKGKRVVMVYPIDKWVLMLIEAGAKITNLGDVKWCATEDGTQGKGTGRHIACFELGEEATA